MTKISFKERVKNVIVLEAKNYKKIYVDYEYLICSSAFTRKQFYLIDAKADNYQHLTGVNALITSQEFYNKALDGTLEEIDFNFIKRNQNEKSVKGSVRRKINVLPNMMSIFDHTFEVQENFIKNRVVCNFATADNSCTIGYKDVGDSIPISLLSGCELDQNISKPVDLVLRKKLGSEMFDEILIGDIDKLTVYFDYIKELLSDELVENVSKKEK